MIIKSEIAATVWQIRVIEGDDVGEGDPLLILESMKMEIPVESPTAGCVEKVLVAQGQTVEEGDGLVELS